MSGAINQSIVYEFTAKNLDGITNQIKAMYEQVAQMAPALAKGITGARSGLKDYARTLSELETRGRQIGGTVNEMYAQRKRLVSQLEQEIRKLNSSAQKDPGRTKNLEGLTKELEFQRSLLRAEYDKIKAAKEEEKQTSKLRSQIDLMNDHLKRSTVYAQQAQNGFIGIANDAARARKEADAYAAALRYANRAVATNPNDKAALAQQSALQQAHAMAVNKAKELTEAERNQQREELRTREAARAAHRERMAADRERRTALREQALQQQAIASGIRSTIGPLIQMAGAYIGIRGIINQIGQGIDFNLMIEQSTTAFTVMTKSQVKAQELMSDLKKLQSQTGIGIREGAAGAKSLLAYGFGVEDITDNLVRLKTVAGAVGAPLEDIVYVYGTLRTQGRAYTRDIMQFAMRGIPIYEALATTMGKPVSQIKALTEAGKVGFPEVEKAFKWLVGGGGPFSGMLEARMQTLAGKIDLLGKTWESSLGKMAEASDGPLRELVGALQKALEGIDLSMVGRTVADLISAFTALLPALQAVAAVIGTIARGFALIVNAVASFIKNGGLLKTLFLAMTVFFGMMIAQTVTASAGIVAFGTSALTATPAVATLTAAVRGLGAALSGFLTGPVGMVLGAIGILAGVGTIDFVVNQGIQSAKDFQNQASLDPRLQRDYQYASSGLLAPGQAISRYQGSAQFGGATGNANIMFSTNEEAVRFSQQVMETEKKFNDAIKKIPTILSHADYMTKLWSGEDMTKYIDATTAEAQRIKGDMLKELSSTSSVLAKFGVTVPQALSQFFSNLVNKIQTLGYIAPTTAGNEKDAQKRFVDFKANVLPKLPGYSDQKMFEGILKGSNGYVDPKSDYGKELASKMESAGNQLADVLFNIITKLEVSFNESDQLLARKLRPLYEEFKSVKGKKGTMDVFDQREYQVKMTQTELDNIELEHEQAMKSLQKKYDDAEIKDINLFNAEKAALERYFAMKTAQQTLTEKFDLRQMDLEMDAANRQIALMDLAHQKEMALLQEEAKAKDGMNAEYYKKKMALMEKNFRDERQSARFDSAVSKEIPTMKRDIMDLIDGSLAAFSKMSGPRQSAVWKDTSKLDEEIARLTSVLDAMIKNNPDAVRAGGAATDVASTLIDLEAKKLKMNEESWQSQLDYWKAGVDNFVNDVSQITQGITGIMGALGTKIASGSDIGAMVKSFTQGQSMAQGEAGLVSQGGASASEAGGGLVAGLGQMGGDLITQAIATFADLLLQVESVNKVFNFMGTILGQTVETLKPLLDIIFASIVDVLEPMGAALGAALRPVFGILKILLVTTEVTIRLLLIPLQLLGAVLTWLYDSIIVPVGNAIIDMFNGLFTMLNNLLGWAGVHINLIRRLTTTAEQELAKKAIDRLAIDLDYLREKIRAEADSRIKSAKDLYEVGAIRASEYERKVKALDQIKNYVSDQQVSQLVNVNMTLEEMLGLYKTMYQLQKDYEKTNDPAAIAQFYATTMQNIVDSFRVPQVFQTAGEKIVEAAEKLVLAAEALARDNTSASAAPTYTAAQQAAIDKIAQLEHQRTWFNSDVIDRLIVQQKAILHALGTPGYAIGSLAITRDQFANIHEGEMIIPKSFADGIRSGDLTLGGKGGSIGGDTYVVQVTVQGSVQAENDLADTIAEAIYRRRTRGQLTR